MEELNNLGITTTTNARVLSNRNKEFRKHALFQHPNPHVRNGKPPKPPLFELFPSLEVETKGYIISHFDFFTVEMLRNELVTVMIPMWYKKQRQTMRLKL